MKMVLTGWCSGLMLYGNHLQILLICGMGSTVELDTLDVLVRFPVMDLIDAVWCMTDALVLSLVRQLFLNPHFLINFSSNKCFPPEFVNSPSHYNDWYFWPWDSSGLVKCDKQESKSCWLVDLIWEAHRWLKGLESSELEPAIQSCVTYFWSWTSY